MPTTPSTYLHVAPSFGTGGREMRTVQLMGMTDPGTRHLVLALDGRTDSLTRLREGAEVEVLDERRPTGNPLSRMRSMRAALRRHAPDLLLTYNWGSIEWLAAARFEGLRAVVHHEDGFGPEEADRLLRRRIWFRRLLLPVTRAVIVPSRTLYDIGRKRWRQPESRLLYLPNGVDLQRFYPAPTRPSRDLVFGCVGRIRPEKNQALAVAAFAQAACRSRARLRLVGDGSELEDVRAAARSLGVADRVDFVGAVENTAPEYREIDVFLIPSRTEQMPIALLEAMASRLPVIGTDVGDVREMVAESNREWIGDLHAPERLAHSMDAMADDEPLRQRLGHDNRDQVEREFELESCFRAYTNLYSEIASKPING